MAVRFNRDWIEKKEYKSWLAPEESDITKARCRLCNRSFSLSNMGEPALKSHAQGKKHQSALKSKGVASVKDFLKKPELDIALASKSEEPLREEKIVEASSVAKFALTKEQHKAGFFGH